MLRRTVPVVGAAVMLAAMIAGPAVAQPPSAQVAQVTAGGGHTCALAGDGRAYCWGTNAQGQLGHGDTTDQASPVAVNVPAGVTFTQLTAGLYHTCGLGNDSKAYCWGQNVYGQLGDGDTTTQLSPVAVNAPSGVTFTQITAGEFHTCALGDDTNTYCWGGGAHGQLGDGDATSESSPVVVTAPAAGVTFTKLTAGGYQTCGLGTDAKAYCWGADQFGQLGDGGDTNRASPVPVNAPAAVRFTQLTAGSYHTCGLGNDAKAYCWGAGDTGQLGDGDTTNQPSPVPVNPPVGLTFTELDAGDHHTCGLGNDTKTYCWGSNAQGQLGDGDTTDRAIPVAVNAPSGVTFTQLDPGYNHTCGLGSDTKAYCWGRGDLGQLGNGGTTDRPNPAAVLFAQQPAPPQPPTGVTVTPDDRAITASWTAPTDLGTGTLTGYTATASPGGETCTVGPAAVTTCTITGLTSGTTYTVTVTATTTVGTSTASDPSASVAPGPPPPPTNVTATARGERIVVSWTVPPDLGGEVLTTGYRAFTATASPNGKSCTTGAPAATTCTITGLTNGTPYTVTVVTKTTAGTSAASTAAGPVTPTTGPPAGPMVEVTAGDSHTCGLDRGGNAYCWGDNQAGQLGDGGTATQLSPVAVNAPAAGVTFTQLTAGYQHTCGLGSDSKAYCWGVGRWLGDGDTTNRSSPVAVNAPTGVAFTQLSAGLADTCGLGNDNKAYCWGYGGSGRLGNGDTAYQLSPVAVNAPSGVTFTQLTASSHTCGLGDNTKAYCWGYGEDGRLGNGGTTDQLIPVAVNAPAARVTFTQITAGGYHTCGLGSDAKGYCWGADYHGELGDGGSTNQSTPVAVNAPAAGVTFTQLTTGFSHTCGLGSDTKAYCWGYGGSGQLGDGSTTQRSIPMAVNAPAAGVTFTQLAGGSSHTCGLGSDTKIYCWGAAGTGQLGNGDTTDQPNPVAVLPVESPSAGPLPPTGVTVTAGDGQAVVSWTAPTNLGTGTLTGYTATASPSGKSCTTTGTAAATTCTITALTNGTAYTITVTATTTVGTSTASNPSVAVAPIAPSVGPQSPTGVTAIAGNQQIAASWTAPTDLGTGTLTGYTATASPGGTTCTTTGTAAATTCTITRLTNGTAYTITVTAITTVATSTPSNPSAPVTPGSGPQPPTGVTVTSGDRAITVSWTSADPGDGTPIKYTATASPGGKTCTISSSSSHGGTCTINGVTNGTAYTITMTATTKAGTSPPSSPSGPVTPAAVPLPGRPQPPVISAALPANEAVAVAWQPGALGTGTLLGYTATATATNDPCPATTTPCITTTPIRQNGTAFLAAAALDPATCTTTANAQTCTITGLINGTSYLIAVITHTTTGDSVVDNSGPVVTVTPSNRTLVRGTRFTTTVKASDPAGISRSYLTGADGAGLPRSYNSSTVKAGKDGNRTVTWIVLDTLGNHTTASRTVIVDNTRPTVAFGKAPRNGAKVSKTTTITATASDRNGIARVQLMVNGKQIANDTRAQFAFTLNPAKYGKRFTVKIRAYDRAGNIRYTSQRTYHHR